MHQRHQGTLQQLDADEPRSVGTFDSRSPYAVDHGSAGSFVVRLIRRAATSTVVILTLVTVAVLVVVANVDFGKSKPPPDAANLSTNDLMQTLAGYQMDPVVARAQAGAKQRAYEKEVAAEQAAAKKAKARAKALAEKKAWEALKNRMSHNPTALENQSYAKKMNALKGWGRCYGSLVLMWTHESGWNELASNRYSGAYGIPQALPGSKMASAGPDWQHNAMTQIAWGLGYIGARYGDPCRAWSFWQAHRWY